MISDAARLCGDGLRGGSAEGIPTFCRCPIFFADAVLWLVDGKTVTERFAFFYSSVVGCVVSVHTVQLVSVHEALVKQDYRLGTVAANTALVACGGFIFHRLFAAAALAFSRRCSISVAIETAITCMVFSGLLQEVLAATSAFEPCGRRTLLCIGRSGLHSVVIAVDSCRCCLLALFTDHHLVWEREQRGLEEARFFEVVARSAG